MKILFHCLSFYPALIGGHNSTLYWHTMFLAKNGLQPHIVTSDFGVGDKGSLITEKWVQSKFGWIIYHSEKFIGIPVRIFFTSIRTSKFVDVVHFNGMFNKVTLFLIFFFVLIRKPIILSPRGELFDAALKRNYKLKRIVIFFYSLIRNRILFHATSLDEQKTLEKYFHNIHVEIQSNFIYAEYTQKISEFNHDFLYLGRINPIKNIHLLIEGAFKSMNFMNSDATIIIAGKAWLDYEVKYLKELERLIFNLKMENKVFFIGHVENEIKEEYLKKAFFVVLPSKSENFGNVILEALSKGTPVIASTGTPWHLLKDYNAWYYIESNSESISLTIENSIEMSYEDYKIMSDNSLKLVKDKYDINSSENNWITIYKSISE